MTDSPDPQEGLPLRYKPEGLRLKGLSAGLTVDDIHTSLAWYCDIVGFHLADRHEDEAGELRAASLVAGTQRLVISQDDGAKGEDRVKGQAIRLYLQTSQDVDEVAKAIEERGGTLASQPADMPWGARSFDLVDPSGFQLTITS